MFGITKKKEVSIIYYKYIVEYDIFIEEYIDVSWKK